MKHVEFLVEEESAEAFLRTLLPKLLDADISYAIHPFQGKPDLLSQLPKRLKAYSQWLRPNWRIVVLVDEDRQDCHALKKLLEKAALDAGLATKTRRQAVSGSFSVLNRISIEEIEAWYFGDIPALVGAYPGVPASLGQKEKFRNPDAINGGTWETLERVLQKAGYFPSGLPKIEVARALASKVVPSRNTSKSFRVFCAGLACL